MTDKPAVPPSLEQLLTTWQAWSYRDLLTRAITTATTEGNTTVVEVLTRDLAREPVVEALDALAANTELVHRLASWQFHAIRAARETGATWDHIAQATGYQSGEQVRAGYLTRLEHAERHTPDLPLPPGYRAALDDTEPTDPKDGSP